MASDPRSPGGDSDPSGTGSSGPRPPRLARRLVQWRLPEELAEPLAGDLEEEHHRRLSSGSSRLSAGLWYWGQALALRGTALRHRARRLRAVRPTAERNAPRRVGNRPRPRSLAFMSLHDLKYALRRLTKNPGFSLLAVLTLALGIGGNTAMFSVVNAVLIRDLPLEDPDRLVEVYTSEDDGYPYSTTSYPDFADLRAENEVFSGVAATRTFLGRTDRGQKPALIFGELVSWDYFQTLGVEMALGRAFLPKEGETPETHPVAILGHRTWTNDFGSDPGVLGESIYLNGRPYTVVGVAPEAFTGSLPVLVSGVYVPLMMTNHIMVGSSVDQLQRRRSRSLFVKARLKPGVSVEQAQAAVQAVSRGLEEQYPESNTARLMSVLPAGEVSLHPVVDRALVPVAGLLLGVVGLVLLIACANLASFLLARAEDRRKEIAVRLALGAGRAGLIRQLLVETTVLAFLGGLAGIVLAHWTLGLLMGFQPPLPVPVVIEVSPDRTVLLFTAGVALAAGIVFGLAPALQATNPDVAPTLKDEGTGGGARRRVSLRNALVVTQVAVSFVLLVVAGLFVRSLEKAQAIDPGFYTGPAALVWPMAELSGYETAEEQRVVLQELEERFLAHPLIDAVTQTDRVPLGAGFQTNSFVLPGVPSDLPDGDHDIDNAWVDPNYFETMEVGILRGRAFTEEDAEGEPVAIVSEAFARTYYPGQDVLGLSIGVPGDSQEIRIVGVAEDTKVRTLGEAPRPYVYRPPPDDFRVDQQFVVRGRASADRLLAAALQVVEEVDPNLVLFEAKTMNEHLALMLFPPRMAALLLSAFGGLALALAAIGIYGVVSYAVARRTRELGIRMSLGATATDIVGMAVGGGMRLVLIGAVVGIVLAVGATWSLAGFLYGIRTTDMVTFAVTPVLLCGVALVAAFVPARRATSVDPARALRSE